MGQSIDICQPSRCFDVNNFNCPQIGKAGTFILCSMHSGPYVEILFQLL